MIRLKHILFSVTDSCDARLDGHCYRLTNQGMSKADANMHCQSQNGIVAEIQSMPENNLLIEIQQTYGRSNSFIKKLRMIYLYTVCETPLKYIMFLLSPVLSMMFFLIRG